MIMIMVQKWILRRGIYKWRSITHVRKLDEFLFLFRANYFNLCAIKTVLQNILQEYQWEMN